MHRRAEESAELRSALPEDRQPRNDPGSRIPSEPLMGDTIAAISTPVGEGAIALVRVSGANAIGVAGKIFRGKEKPSKFASHIQHFGEVVDGAGRLIDQVMMSIHRAPASYTAEDLVERSEEHTS